MSRKSLMEVISQLAGPPSQLGHGFEANALALVQQLQIQSLLQPQQYFDHQINDYYLHHLQQNQQPKLPVPTTSGPISNGGGKKRINRGRAFKVHKGAYNVVVNSTIHSAEYSLESLRQELANKHAAMDPIIVNNENICERLSDSVDLLPYLNNPSHCGAIVAGHLFPRDFFINHILRDTDGNVKAAKGFINHSNREPLSREASKLFFDILYYFGGVIIEPTMLESWLWVARKGVNDRGNTSKSGRGVRYFVKPDYIPVLPYDIWHTPTKSEPQSPSTSNTLSSPLSNASSRCSTSSTSEHSPKIEKQEIDDEDDNKSVIIV